MRKNAESIAIYSRKSKFTGKGESIGNQVELCREYVRNFFGEEYVDRCVVFEDEGFSGGNLNRPAFRDMMEGVRKHRFKAIVVYRLDRISRNISDFTSLIDELTKLEVSFVSIREQFDTSTPMGRAMMFIISVFSQLERETIAERIRDNMHELAKTGRWLGGNAPTGFKSEAVSKVTVDGKTRKSFKLVPIPEEAEIPKLIFDLYTETDSLTAVEAELLRRRIRTKQGKDFTRFAIKAILQNPVYMTADEAAYDYFTQRQADVCFPKEAFDGKRGIMAYNRTDQEKGKTTILLPVSQWIIALGQHPGLVPSSQWIKVQESLERNKSKGYRKPRNNEALLTGLLFCSCGERMYPKLSKRVTADGKPIYTYVCKMKERSKRQRCNKRNANGNLLDAAIIEQIKALTEHDSSFLADYRVQLLLIGTMRLRYVALMALVFDLLFITSSNGGGHIAHLGGAATGLLWAWALGKGTDLTRGIHTLINSIESLFSRKPRQPKMKIRYGGKHSSDYDYNARKKADDEAINQILDKLKKSGYESLTTEEKQRLFNASRR